MKNSTEEIEVETVETEAVEGEESEERRPKVTVEMFREGFVDLARARFEDWCSQYQLNAARRYQEAKQVLCALKRIGLAQSVWQADAEMVQVWGEQVAESEVLSGAMCDEIALDYSDPIVLKYLALYLWTEEHEKVFSLDIANGPIVWSEYIADDLLQAKVFGR